MQRDCIELVFLLYQIETSCLSIWEVLNFKVSGQLPIPLHTHTKKTITKWNVYQMTAFNQHFDKEKRYQKDESPRQV